MSKILRVSQWFIFILILGLIVEYNFGLVLKDKIEIEKNDIRSVEGLGAKFRIPKKYRAQSLNNTCRVYENSKLIGKKVVKKNDVVKFGQGRFRISEWNLWFSSSDESDVKLNDKVYHLTLPYKFPFYYILVLFVILIFLIDKADWKKLHLKVFNNKNILILSILVFLLTLGVRYGVYKSQNHKTFTYDTFMVKNMPYSDALGWVELANNLSNNHGISGPFDGNRPFYPIFLSAWLKLFDSNIKAAQFLNIIAVTFSVTILFYFVSRISNIFLGICIITPIIFSKNQLELLNLPLTEIWGFSLMLMFLIVFTLAILKKSNLLLFNAGLVFAFTNLTQTVNLQTLPLYILLIFIYFYKKSDDFTIKQKLRKVIFSVIFFVFGFVIIIAPWLFRQHLKHGVATLSFSGIEILYGVTTENDQYHYNMYADFLDKGVLEDVGIRYNFFKQQYKQNVLEDPIHYVKKVVLYSKMYLDDFYKKYYHKNVVIFYYMLFGLSTLLYLFIKKDKNVWQDLIILALSVLSLIYIFKLPFYLLVISLVIISWIYAFIDKKRSLRIFLEILMIHTVTCVLLMGMFGKMFLIRFSIFINWSIVFYIILGAYCIPKLINIIILKFNYEEDEKTVPAEKLKGTKTLTTIIILFNLVLISISASVFYNNKFLAKNTNEKLINIERGELYNQIFKSLPEEIIEPYNSNNIYLNLVESTGYQCFIEKNESVGHWSRAFKKLNKARYVVKFRTLTNFGSGVNFLQTTQLFTDNREINLGENKKYILIGVNNYDENAKLAHDKFMVNALALICLDKTSLDNKCLDDLDNLDDNQVFYFEPINTK